jgi:hypothetical protein
MTMTTATTTNDTVTTTTDIGFTNHHHDARLASRPSVQIQISEQGQDRLRLIMKAIFLLTIAMVLQIIYQSYNQVPWMRS